MKRRACPTRPWVRARGNGDPAERAQQGETLIELLITVTIMGVLFVAVMAGTATSISMSDFHRQDGTAEGVIRSYAERVSDPTDVPYVDCGSVTTATYATPIGFTLPNADWTASVTSVTFWQGATLNPAFSSACPSPDKGLQQITLQVQSKAGKSQARESVVIVKRKP
jgi:prepilin-type N-terminal cleavage/methylation domain-containing protein